MALFDENWSFTLFTNGINNITWKSVLKKRYPGKFAFISF